MECVRVDEIANKLLLLLPFCPFWLIYQYHVHAYCHVSLLCHHFFAIANAPIYHFLFLLLQPIFSCFFPHPHHPPFVLSLLHFAGPYALFCILCIFFPNKMLLTWLFSENRNCICNAFNFKHKLEKKTIFELAFKDECLICEMGGGVGRMVNDKEEASLSAVITKCKQTGLSL